MRKLAGDKKLTTVDSRFCKLESDVDNTLLVPSKE